MRIANGNLSQNYGTRIDIWSEEVSIKKIFTVFGTKKIDVNTDNFFFLSKKVHFIDIYRNAKKIKITINSFSRYFFPIFFLPIHRNSPIFYREFRYYRENLRIDTHRK